MPHVSRKATIYDVAKAAQISAPAVSLVLRGLWRDQRISEKTAKKVLEKADELGYSVNLGARGLRLSRSGLCGMLVPHYRNRFFAGLAESFENEARRRGLCPVVVSTHRDGKTERQTAETLVSHQVEFLFVAGVNDPVEINRLCAAANIRSINIDLPGSEAPSVISDNRAAARDLTELLLRRFTPGKEVDFLFLGGNASDNATIERIEGVRDAFRGSGIALTDSMFDCCGYQPARIASVVASIYRKRARSMPSLLFVNGIPVLEGLLQARATLHSQALEDCTIGCYDWDPFAASLSLDITFVRQDVDALIAAGFKLLSDCEAGDNPTVRIPASLRPSRGQGAANLQNS